MSWQREPCLLLWYHCWDRSQGISICSPPICLWISKVSWIALYHFLFSLSHFPDLSDWCLMIGCIWHQQGCHCELCTLISHWFGCSFYHSLQCLYLYWRSRFGNALPGISVHQWFPFLPRGLEDCQSCTYQVSQYLSLSQDDLTWWILLAHWWSLLTHLTTWQQSVVYPSLPSFFWRSGASSVYNTCSSAAAYASHCYCSLAAAGSALMNWAFGSGRQLVVRCEIVQRYHSTILLMFSCHLSSIMRNRCCSLMSVDCLLWGAWYLMMSSMLEYWHYSITQVLS